MSDPGDLRSFTSRKLSIQNAMMKDDRLRPNEFKVATALLSHADAETGHIFPSQKLIAVELGISVPTVKRAIKSLTEMGWLTVTRKNRQSANRYEFLRDQVTAIEGEHVKVVQALRDQRRLVSEGSKPPEGSALIPPEGSPVIPKHLQGTPKAGIENKITPDSVLIPEDDPSEELGSVLSTVPATPPLHSIPFFDPSDEQAGERAVSSAVATPPALAPDPVLHDLSMLMILPDDLHPTTWCIVTATGEVLSEWASEADAFREVCRLHPNPVPKYPSGGGYVAPNFDKIGKEHEANIRRRERKGKAA